MKQEKAKKMPKWLLPVIIAAAVLVVAGIVLAIFLGSQGQGNEPDAVQSEIYWNIDRVKFIDPETNMSTREPAADGDYVIRFSLNGEVVSYKCADKRLVNAIDFMDALGLVFDAHGMIVDALDPKSFSKEVARDFFIKSISEDQLIVNSSIAMNGMETVVPLSAVTGIYNVDPSNNGEGQKDTCQIMDKVTIFGQKDGDATTHVFITERAKGDGVYYRVDQCYDKTRGSTTREPDENGVYTITFAYEGQQLDLKCKDVELVSEIDKQNDPKHHMGLIFDEEGYIIEYVNAAVALRGKMAYRLMTVTAVGGNIATIEDKVGDGADGSADLHIDADCDIFLVEDGCEAEFIGQRTDKLQLNDMVTVYTDLEGKPILIYITRRTIDADMYYNVSRKYSSTTKETTRKPDESGWYNYEMITLNKKVELRTKDKAIASKVDSFSGKVMGLKLNGKTIVDVYHPYCLSGYGHVGEGRYVTDMMGQIIRIVSSSNFEKGGNYITSPEGSLVIDTTGDYSAKTGAPVEFRKGDKVTAYTNSSKDITHGVVSARYYEGTKLYYNIDRQYRTAKKSTIREPDENGYYVFDMMCEGKEVQVKTKDKDLATFIDKDSYRFSALKVSKSGIIQAAYQDVSAILYGTKQASGVYYDSTNPDGTINYYYFSGDKRIDKKTGHAITNKTVIYNYSDGYINTRGEKTTLQKGDRIQGYGSLETKQMQVIFVRERKVDSKLYWYTSRKYNSTTEETTREPDGNGYYWVDLITQDGEIKTFKTKSKEVMSKVDSYATAFGLKLNGDVIVQAYYHDTIKGIGGYVAGYYDAMEIKSDSIVFVRNRPASSSTGKSSEYPTTKNMKVVNVTTGTDKYGKKDTIGVGDRTANYTNEDGKIICTFIVNKNTHKDGAISYCEHCGKEVWWEHFTGTIYDAEAHYYLPKDYSTTSQKYVGYETAELAADETLKQYEIVLDLNGNTWTNTNSTNVLVRGTLSILDSVGGGQLVGKTRCVTLSSQGGAVLNLYGGTLTEGATESTTNGGIIYGNNATINMYGGTISGGIGGKGGNLYLASTDFNMYGGKITGGTSTGVGPNIYAFGKSVLNIQDGIIDGDVVVAESTKVFLAGNVQIAKGLYDGIKLEDGIKLDISQLSADSRIVVDGRDLITTERDDIDAFLDVFTPVKENDSIVKSGKALKYVKETFTYTTEQSIEIANSAEFAAKFANGGAVYAVCPVCGTEEKWMPIGAGTAEAPKTTQTEITGHVYYDKDTWTTGPNILTGDTATGCVFLNGKTVTGTGRIRANKAINIMGTGKIIKNDGEHDNPMFALDSSNTKLNIYGGEFINNEAGQAMFKMTGTTYGSGVGNIYAGTFQSTTGTNLHMAHEDAEFNLHGGTLTGAAQIDTGKVTIGSVKLQGDVIVAKAATVTLTEKPEITGILDLSSGALVTLRDLATDASVLVKANGTFTQPISNTADYLTANTFAVPAGYQAVKAVGNALWTAPEGYEPPAPTTPEWSENTVERIDQWLDTYAADFTAASAAASGETVTTAICPICGAANVNWKPRTSNNSVAAENNAPTHYYLYSDVVRNTFDACGSNQSNPICVYLNNKTYSTTGSFQIKNTLNIFDDPDVAGGKVLGADGTAKGGTYVSIPLFRLTANTDTVASVLNIYYGEYESAQPHVEGVNDDGTALIAAQVDEAQAYIYGATLSNTAHGEAVRVAAGNVVLENCAVNDGVNVTGGELKLAGETIVEAPGVVLAEGVVMNIADLAATASVAVQGENGKLISAASDNAATVKDRFTVVGATGLRVDVNADEQLFITDGTTPEQPGGGEQPPALTPEQQIKANVDAWLLANKDAFAAGGNVTTDTCPICGAENVTWTAKSSGRWTSGSHLYLTASYSATSFDQIGSSHSSARCVYLNNYTYTSEGTFSVKNTLNIFDDPNTPGGGIVDANSVNTNAQYEKQPMFKLNGSAPVLNIYYGTYETQQAHLAGANDNGTALIGSEVAAAQTYIYGATLNNTGYGEVLRAGNGTVVLENCTLNGSSGYVSDEGVTYGGSIYMNGGTVTLKGVTVAGGTAANGSVYVADGTLTLSGDTTIAAPGLDLTSGAKVTLENLGANASVVVKANGVFAETEKAAEYAALLKPAAGYWTITAVDNTLQTRPTTLTAEAMAIVETANSAQFAAQFANGGTVTAVCPVCGGEAVEWTRVTGSIGSDKSGHFYFDHADDYAGHPNQNFLKMAGKVCVYLNNKSVSIAGRFSVTKELNIIGNGTIIRNDSKYDGVNGGEAVPMFAASSANTLLNIYGGTFINNEPNMPLVKLNNTGIVNLYAGSFTGNVEATAGTLNIFDATVTGNLNVTAPAVLNQAALPVQAASQENGDEASQTVKS